MSDVLAPGALIAQGKYRVERVLGAGGMGLVVSAIHVGFDDRVAIKVLHPIVAANPEIVQRFLREGRAARKIRSEHVVQVTDVGMLENGAPYMVMEFLDGEDLSQRLRRIGPFAIEEAIELLLQACEAIAEAHVNGIVHRDLKPANLFHVARRGGGACVKVLDFGISKISGGNAASAALTNTSATMGSPVYMSPEQLQSMRDVDARSDIWALGVILYELLTGNHPFKGEDLPRLCVQIISHPPRPVDAYRSGVPAPLVAAIHRCLAKSPAQRFADVGAFATALLPFANERARVSVGQIVAMIASAAPTTSSPGGDAGGPSRPPWASSDSETRTSTIPFDDPAASAPRETASSTVGARVLSNAATSDGAGARANRWLFVGGALVVLAIGVGAGTFAARRTPAPGKPETASAGASPSLPAPTVFATASALPSAAADPTTIAAASSASTSSGASVLASASIAPPASAHAPLQPPAQPKSRKPPPAPSSKPRGVPPAPTATVDDTL